MRLSHIFIIGSVIAVFASAIALKNNELDAVSIPIYYGGKFIIINGHGEIKENIAGEVFASKIISAMNQINGSSFSLSPDRRGLAYFSGKDLIINKGNDQRISFEQHSSYSIHDRVDWISNEEVIAFLEGATDYLYRINVSTKEQTLLCKGDINNKFQNGLLDVRYRGKKIDCMDNPAFKVIFGSSEWPVLTIIPFSSGPNGRYYFYERSQESGIFPSTTWIEGYDRKTGNIFKVKTLRGFWADYQAS